MLRWGRGLKGTWVEEDCDAYPYDVILGTDIVSNHLLRVMPILTTCRHTTKSPYRLWLPLCDCSSSFDRTYTCSFPELSEILTHLRRSGMLAVSYKRYNLCSDKANCDRSTQRLRGHRSRVSAQVHRTADLAVLSESIPDQDSVDQEAIVIEKYCLRHAPFESPH